MATLAGVPPQDSRLANANPEYLVGFDKANKKFYVQGKALECLTSNSGTKTSILTLWGEPKSGIIEVLLSLFNKKARKGSDHPGIYMWDIPLKAIDKQGQTNHVYIAEVIGLAHYSTEERQKLLVITYLISSGMVFCSQGDVGEHSFELWSSLVEGLPRIEIYAANQHLNDMYASTISPNLLWCMTGRRAPLTNSRGGAISSQSYLEDTLKRLAEGQANDLRPHIVKFMNAFKNRSCIDVSAFQEKELVNPDLVKSLCMPYILKNMSELRPAYANGPKVSNQGLSSLIPSIVEAVNGSAPVNLVSLFESTYVFELKAALANSKLEYVKEIQEIFEARDFDPSQDFVETTLKRLRANANNTLSAAAQIDEQSTLVQELVEVHLELDEFIEARERAVRKKQEVIKTRLAKNFLESFQHGPEDKWRNRLYNMSTFQTFQEDMKKQYDSMVLADLTPEVNSVWMEKLKVLYPEYMQSLRNEMMETFNKRDLLMEEKAETKKQLLQSIENEEKAIKEAEKQLKRLQGLTAQETEAGADCLQEIIQLQVVVGQIEHEEKQLVTKNQTLTGEETSKKGRIEALKKELEHVIKNAG